ncbi:glycosyltransferase [Oryzibacter oryziterrae]|uniref:glycosyltransferase n=1 Tax=Oryzibacter oryziterrae TaxID=2766474 RepID=UPI001F456366|nr:glycosyltransferase [Oryzibacter oryziterrae]
MVVKKLKIVFYIHALAGGGAERVWALMATALAQMGHEVLFAVDYKASANIGMLAGSIPVIELGSGHFTAILALMRLLLRERPDVSISALGASNIKHVVAALLAGRRRRAIISYHGYAENEPKRLSRLSFTLAPLLTRLAGRTVAVSEDLTREVVRRHGGRADRIATILNPVAVPPIEVSDATLAARPPIVLAASRLTPMKDLPFLVRAFALLKTPDARLVILGEGDERAQIEAEVDRVGIRPRVEFAGYQEKPWPWYASAKVFALPSRVEAFGLTVVEALAHGLPVVATNCGGPREILDRPGLGILTAHGDEAAFAAALDACLADPGQTAPRMARALDFSVKSRAEAYLDLMTDVAENA